MVLLTINALIAVNYRMMRVLRIFIVKLLIQSALVKELPIKILILLLIYVYLWVVTKRKRFLS